MVNCPICFEEASNPHYTVPCRHTFCFRCISVWDSATCPLCRETVRSYKPVCQEPTRRQNAGPEDQGSNSTRRHAFITLVIAFLLVDIQSESGISSNIAYPLCQTVCFSLWEITYILLLIISVPIKCIYRFVVELMIYDVVDIGYALYQMPFNILEILLNLPMCIYDGIKSIFLQNSWYSLFQKTVHLLVVMLLSSDSVWKTLTRIVKHIQTDQRYQKISKCISQRMIRQQKM